jgi:hypothetical protein
VGIPLTKGEAMNILLIVVMCFIGGFITAVVETSREQIKGNINEKV